MTILDKRPHLRAGEKQRFVCVATGSRPEAILSWWVEGEAVRAEGGRVTSAASGERTTSSLYFVPRPQDSGKTLHCRASTPQIHRGVIQDSWKLDIQCELLPNLHSTLKIDQQLFCFKRLIFIDKLRQKLLVRIQNLSESEVLKIGPLPKVEKTRISMF